MACHIKALRVRTYNLYAAGRLFTGASVAAVLYLQAVLRTCGYYVRAEIDGFPVDTSALVTGGLQAIVLQFTTRIPADIRCSSQVTTSIGRQDTLLKHRDLGGKPFSLKSVILRDFVHCYNK